MNISDLNHLEVVNEDNKVVGRGSLNQYTDIYKDVDIDFYEDVDVYKNLYTYSSVRGNSAFAEGDASASGPHTNAEAFSFTYTDPYFSSAGATSLSQSDSYCYYCY
ncbi:MAG: hypothetical protein RID53_27125 [Coleofasciculus sp. B1-GNL1-01]|uniref:hypothetical protein n=1 Tax=Coleofasciculus sp. B1-GNL1-01 TaxID=3068484 RepID=UPI0032FBE84B